MSFDISDHVVKMDDVAGTTTEVLELKNARSASVQAQFTVTTPSASTFLGGTDATLVNQDLTYTSNLGAGGNAVSVEYVNTGDPDEALSVSVEGSEIQVTLATDSGAFADVTIQDLDYTAVALGDSGNDISVEYVEPAVELSPLSVDVTGTNIVVNLEMDAGDAAQLVLGDITYTAVDAGVAGNDISIQCIGDGVAGAETIDVTGLAIVVHMDSYQFGGSTAQNITDAVNGHIQASALVTASRTGDDDVQTVAASTNLTGGGENLASVSTATEVKAAIEANLDADALVGVTISGTGSNVQVAAVETSLADGADPAITSDADAVLAAVNGDGDAAELVVVTGTGATPLVALAQTYLTGGTNAGVNVTTNELTTISHGFTTGLKGQLTSTGTLPTGLATSTDYFIIKVDNHTFKLASSLANALAGTAIDITHQGTPEATHTFTPTSLAGGSIKFEKSNDGVNWYTEGSATNITATGGLLFEKVDPTYKYLRIYYTLTAGRMNTVNHVFVRGFN